MAGAPVCAITARSRRSTSERDRDALDDRGAERVGQEVARRSAREGRGCAGRRAARRRAGRRSRRARTSRRRRRSRAAAWCRPCALSDSSRLRLCCAESVSCAPGAHEDLAVEHRVRRAVDDASCAAGGCAPFGCAWSISVCVSASWRSGDQREPVDRALRRLRRLQHVQVVAREPRAERDRLTERSGASCASDTAQVAIWNAWPLSRCTPDVVARARSRRARSRSTALVKYASSVQRRRSPRSRVHSLPASATTGSAGSSRCPAASR